jgi:hypothetical protein
VLLACGDSGRPADTAGVSGSTGTTTATATTDSSGSTLAPPTTGGPPTTGVSASEGSSSSSSGGGAQKFDVGNEPDTETTGPVDVCKVAGDGDAGSCRTKAPADAFTPEVQWSWTGMGADVFSGVSPLVANLTDDNGDGVIDLCDVPDVQPVV